MNLPDVSVIGTGALGGTLARALHLRDIRIKSIYNRTKDKSRALASDLNVDQTGAFPGEREELGRLIILAVPDGAIEEAARQLAGLSDDWTGYSVVHCSGNESASLLDVLREKGAHTATFHPLQTFNPSSRPSDFHEIYFDIEGDGELLDLLEAVGERMGSKTFRVTPEVKSYLHAAAVMSSNYLVALLYAAEQIAQLGGMDLEKARSALFPLVRKSLENGREGELSDVLSGPIARGDSSTVRRHLRLLEPNDELVMLYKLLGKQALKLAKKKDSLDPGQIVKLEYLLNS